MKTDKEKTTELSEIYQPLLAHVVLEARVPTKTASGLTMPKHIMEEIRRSMSPAMKVIAVGPDVKTVKVGQYVLPNFDARNHTVPLIYTDPNGEIGHVQCHETEILGIVDTKWQLAKMAEVDKIQSETKTLPN